MALMKPTSFSNKIYSQRSCPVLDDKCFLRHWGGRCGESHSFFLFIYLFLAIQTTECSNRERRTFKIFSIGLQLIYNAVLVSGVQQSDSVIHIRISILFQILFPFRLLQNIEQSSLCYSRSLLVIYVKCSSVYMLI